LSWFSLRLRKVYMDFHTPEFPKNFLEILTSKKYISTLKDANVNAAVFFAKDHRKLLL